jgi:thiosulfate/3-mercaptopyruvate sulfurtransferase
MKAPETLPRPLVGTDWLAAHLDDPRVRVLDATTHLPPKPDFSLYDVVPGIADFRNGHIPGAGFVDIEHEVSRPHPRLHFMLPDADTFARAMAGHGMSDDSFVVAYSTANHWWATRLWWMLRVFGHDRVAVLDGGFQKWSAEGRPVDSGPPRAVAPGRARRARKCWPRATTCWPPSATTASARSTHCAPSSTRGEAA